MERKRQISFVFFPTEEIIVPEKFIDSPDKLLEFNVILTRLIDTKIA